MAAPPVPILPGHAIGWLWKQARGQTVTELILVRHGQANSHATDEESYDRLSPLGHEQAGWLGAHLRDTNPHFDAVITGTLNRQQDTARAMGFDITRTDPRLNELRYFDLARVMEEAHGIPAPQSTTEFALHLPQVMEHWVSESLPGVPETFSAFQGRIRDCLDEFCTGHGRVLLVTSGGVIGAALHHVLGLQTAGMSKVMLQVMNSSLHRFHYVHGSLMLGSFNATPHLDLPARAHARTFV